MGRQDSTTLLATNDFGIDHNYMWLRLTEKQCKHVSLRRIVRIPINPPQSHGVPSAVPDVVDLARRFLESKRALGDPQPFLFQLPGEPPPTTATMSAWVARGLQAPTFQHRSAARIRLLGALHQVGRILSGGSD